MVEAKKTLLDVVKPLVVIFNLLYGFNLGRKGATAGWAKMLISGIIWLALFFALLYYYISRVHEGESAFEARWISLNEIFCCGLYLFACNEPEMQRLVRRLEGHRMGKQSRKATSKMIWAFFLSLALIFLPTLEFLHHFLPSIADYCSQKKCSLGDVIFTISHIIFICIFLGLEAILHFFPVLLSCLCCMLVIYSPSRLDDHIENIRKAYSPHRRARLLSNLCYEYYRLQPLASMTNRNMATTMSLFKLLTMLLWAFCFTIPEETVKNAKFKIPVLPYSIPLLTYLIVAPSANDMQCKIFEAAAEVLMVDDQWQSRDPISSSRLIKLRLNLLNHLVHIRMDQGPFTLLGDSVDPETLFMIVLEINDLRTTLR